MRRYVLTTILVLAAVFTLVESIVSQFITIPENWFVFVIFVTMIAIVEMLKNVEDLERSFEDVLSESGWSQVTRYPNFENFYEDLSESVEDAEESLYLTHIRNESPDDFDAESTKEYFDKLEHWCQTHPSGRVKRITTLSNPKMVSWGEELVQRTERISNFYVRICDWEFKFPFINLAIIDEQEVYIALTADQAEETTGLRIQDDEIATSFVKYFNNVWSKSTELKKGLESKRGVEIKQH